jgi:hypothetical protein
MASTQYNKNEFSVLPVGAHTRNASLGTAVTLTVPANASGLFLQVESGNINYTLDGTTPTTGATGVGFKRAATDGVVRIDLHPLATVRVIEQAASAVIQYQFFTSF